MKKAKKKKKEKSLYTDKGAEEALEDDEISSEEEGFMHGYNDELDEELKESEEEK